MCLVFSSSNHGPYLNRVEPHSLNAASWSNEIELPFLCTQHVDTAAYAWCPWLKCWNREFHLLCVEWAMSDWEGRAMGALAVGCETSLTILSRGRLKPRTITRKKVSSWSGWLPPKVSLNLTLENKITQHQSSPQLEQQGTCFPTENCLNLPCVSHPVAFLHRHVRLCTQGWMCTTRERRVLSLCPTYVYSSSARGSGRHWGRMEIIHCFWLLLFPQPREIPYCMCRPSSYKNDGFNFVLESWDSHHHFQSLSCSYPSIYQSSIKFQIKKIN